MWLCCGQDVWGMCPIWELEITFESEHKIMMNRAEEELLLLLLLLLPLPPRRDQFHEIGTRGGSVTKYKIGIPDILYMSRMLYAGQSAREIVTFLIDF